MGNSNGPATVIQRWPFLKKKSDKRYKSFKNLVYFEMQFQNAMVGYRLMLLIIMAAYMSMLQMELLSLHFNWSSILDNLIMTLNTLMYHWCREITFRKEYSVSVITSSNNISQSINMEVLMQSMHQTFSPKLHFLTTE